jgi:hypothetical protein
MSGQEDLDPPGEDGVLLRSVEAVSDGVGNDRRPVGVQPTGEAELPHEREVGGQAQRDVELLADPGVGQAPQLADLDHGLLARCEREMRRLLVPGRIVGLATPEEGDEACPLLGGRAVLCNSGSEPAGEQVVVGQVVQVGRLGWSKHGHRSPPERSCSTPDLAESGRSHRHFRSAWVQSVQN